MKKSIFGVIVLLSMVLLLLGTVSLSFADSCCGGDCGPSTPVPEPSTFILFGSMIIGALVVKKVITWDS